MKIMDEHDGKTRRYTRRDVVVDSNTVTILIIVNISWIIPILSDLTAIFSIKKIVSFGD
jgi:hypothetical protein